MKALLQRVSRASVSVGGEVVGSIGPGLVVFVGVAAGDGDEDIEYLVSKVVGLRIFADDSGKFNLSVEDIGGELLLVSQFTLLASTRKGRRPGFTDAAPPEEAARLFERFVARAQATGTGVATGRFQEHMEVEIHNDGPVTIMLDCSERHLPRAG